MVYGFEYACFHKYIIIIVVIEREKEGIYVNLKNPNIY